ncbi:hypothetical protein L228DRAFT_245050 [Xylona heveae TC161]|uniref:Uncharacterized protein n=1 Tax=Xylona heveae (strain CBS 132557 / TC161) TaxID=1328760 RepID=A0A165I021_XYLHT|nr:hypothetical protein L228DRAFT_245050 [Xylona heveae TC161]KZF24162.1 hypothetical protein L228DRAFT_245050 [Xylona heveae TC161]
MRDGRCVDSLRRLAESLSIQDRSKLSNGASCGVRRAWPADSKALSASSMAIVYLIGPSGRKFNAATRQRFPIS